MKKYLCLIALLALCLFVCRTAMADISTSTTLGTATGISTTITEVDANGTATPADDIFLSPPVASMAFGTLSLASGTTTVSGHVVTWQTYLPAHYFCVDIAPTGGVFTTSNKITVGYSGASARLGTALKVTAVKTTISFTTGLTTDAAISGKVGIPANIGDINQSDWNGGWLRLYVGMVDGSESPAITGGAAFTPADPAGAMSGTVTLTFA